MLDTLQRAFDADLQGRPHAKIALVVLAAFAGGDEHGDVAPVLVTPRVVECSELSARQFDAAVSDLSRLRIVARLDDGFVALFP